MEERNEIIKTSTLESILESLTKNKSAETIAQEMEEATKGMDMPGRQRFAYELARMSPKSFQKKLEKSVGKYNEGKEGAEQLKTLGEMQETVYAKEDDIYAVFEKFGGKYGSTNALVDSYVDDRLMDALQEMSQYARQEAINNINRALKDDGRKAFGKAVAKYCQETGEMYYVSNAPAAGMAKDIASVLEIADDERQGASPEALAELMKAKELDFMERLMATQEALQPKDYQAVIDALDARFHDAESAKLLDDAVRTNNKHSTEKFETRRVRLTNEEKGSSWQKLEHESGFSKAFHEMSQKVHNMKKAGMEELERGGLLYPGFALYMGLTKTIQAIADYISEKIEYRCPKDADYRQLDPEKEEAKGEAGAGKAAGEGPAISHGDADPFYAVMMDAYSQKGKELTEMLGNGTINANQARELFVMDMAYIAQQSPAKQNELFSRYTTSLREALGDNQATLGTKQSIRTLIADYDAGKLDKEIKQAASQAIDWEKWHQDNVKKGQAQEAQAQGAPAQEAKPMFEKKKIDMIAGSIAKGNDTGFIAMQLNSVMRKMDSGEKQEFINTVASAIPQAEGAKNALSIAVDKYNKGAYNGGYMGMDDKSRLFRSELLSGKAQNADAKEQSGDLVKFRDALLEYADKNCLEYGNASLNDGTGNEVFYIQRPGGDALAPICIDGYGAAAYVRTYGVDKAIGRVGYELREAERRGRDILHMPGEEPVRPQRQGIWPDAKKDVKKEISEIQKMIQEYTGKGPGTQPEQAEKQGEKHEEKMSPRQRVVNEFRKQEQEAKRNEKTESFDYGSGMPMPTQEKEPKRALTEEEAKTINMQADIPGADDGMPAMDEGSWEAVMKMAGEER